MNYSTQVDGAVEFEVNSLYEARLKVLDKRKARGKRYGLASVLRLSVLAKLGGEDEPEGMADRVKQRGQALRESLQRWPGWLTHYSMRNSQCVARRQFRL